MKDIMNPLLKETLIFRPLTPHANMLRYAGGEWIPDDGKLDMAFIYYADAPIVECVDMPYYANILWSWWEAGECGRLWHYCTTNNQGWENCRFEGRREHPNEIAGDSGMKKCCDLYHIANGRSISITSDNEYIKLGKLIIQSTGLSVIKPENIACFLCLNNGYGHRLRELQRKKAGLEGDKEYYESQIKEHETDLLDTKASLEHTNASLVELDQLLTKAEGEVVAQQLKEKD